MFIFVNLQQQIVLLISTFAFQFHIPVAVSLASSVAVSTNEPVVKVCLNLFLKKMNVL